MAQAATKPRAKAITIEPLERRTLMAAPVILFIRGATRSGGFLEAANDTQRTEHLADINNTSTASGNHGWGTLAATLRSAGFLVEQMTEPLEAGTKSTGQTTGAPIRFESVNLSRYAAIVFGSNNAVYPKASIDAIDNYVRSGHGGALFISDANFGSSWRDAPDSDQQFLSRYGLKMQQDTSVYTLTRTGGDFAVPGHPVLMNVNSFDGEGVSPVVVPTTPPTGVKITRLVGARDKTRNNDGTLASNKFAGSVRAVNSRDASVVLANAGNGRIATFFDRNTFFNANGVGSNINKLNNKQLALNLFGWIADQTPPAVIARSFKQGAPSELKLTFDDNLLGSMTRGDVLLRTAQFKKPIPTDDWSFALTETLGRTNLLIKIKGRTAAGNYELQINAGRISDDSGNATTTTFKYLFTIAATTSATSIVTPTTTFGDALVSSRLAKDLFGDAE
jgi:hypothetical protein